MVRADWLMNSTAVLAMYSGYTRLNIINDDYTQVGYITEQPVLELACSKTGCSIVNHLCYSLSKIILWAKNYCIKVL